MWNTTFNYIHITHKFLRYNIKITLLPFIFIITINNIPPFITYKWTLTFKPCLPFKLLSKVLKQYPTGMPPTYFQVLLHFILINFQLSLFIPSPTHCIDLTYFFLVFVPDPICTYVSHTHWYLHDVVVVWFGYLQLVLSVVTPTYQ